MRNLILTALILACSAPLTCAQSADDYNKVEVFGGFSHNRVDNGIADDLGSIIDERTGFNGFNASVTGNVSRHVGLKFDFSGHYNTRDDGFGICIDSTEGGLCLNLRTESALYNFLGGVQFKDNAREARLKPFAHALAGVAHRRDRFSDADGDGDCLRPGFVCATLSELGDSETGFAAALGGGLDVRVSERVDIRAFQLDYNPTRLQGTTLHNFRLGVGVVIH